jgi:hypothetical protein
MKLGRKRVSIFLSLALVFTMLFFSLSNAAWVLMGRPNETYPELLFLIAGLPASVALLILSILKR